MSTPVIVEAAGHTYTCRAAMPIEFVNETAAVIGPGTRERVDFAEYARRMKVLDLFVLAALDDDSANRYRVDQHSMTHDDLESLASQIAAHVFPDGQIA